MSQSDAVCKLECNLDDCTGENLGFVMELLFAAGARDVFYTPIFMKKNRPGVLLSVIADPEKAGEMENIIFHQTTTIGIRRQEMDRTVLKREKRSVQTPYGEASVKVVCLPDEIRCYPEYEDAAQLCRKTGRPFGEICEMIRTAAKEEKS